MSPTARYCPADGTKLNLQDRLGAARCPQCGRLYGIDGKLLGFVPEDDLNDWERDGGR